MADVKRKLSTDRWRALVVEADAGNPAVKSQQFVDGYRYIDVTAPVESRGFIFLPGVYRAA